MTRIPYRFQGYSGAWYNFAMSDLPTAAQTCCGVYLFGRRRPNGSYDVLYIGRAQNLANRLTNSHEKLATAIRKGMTTLGQAMCANDTEASQIERDLIARFNPPLNIALRTG